MCLPCAFEILGLRLGTAFIVGMAICSHLSMQMYVKTRELLPVKLNETWEVAYMLFGRKSIFLLCGVSVAFGWVLCVSCFLSAVNTVTAIFYGLVSARETGFSSAPGWMQWICNPNNILIVASVARLPLVRSQDRPSFSSAFIIFRLALFIAVIYVELWLGNTLYGDHYEINWDGMMTLKVDTLPLQPILIVMLCFSIQYVAIPAYCELEDRTP